MLLLPQLGAELWSGAIYRPALLHRRTTFAPISVRLFIPFLCSIQSGF